MTKEPTPLTAALLNPDVNMGTKRPQLTWDLVWEASDVSAHVRRHLLRVYTTLGLMVLFAAIGVLLDLRWPVDPAITGLAITLPLLFAIMFSPPAWLAFRLTSAMLLATSMGASIGSLVQRVLALDPALVGLAFGCTTLIFVTMSLCAYFATRRASFFLYGLLVSALLVLLVLGVATLFLHESFLVYLSLYGGLVLFSLFVILDTQLMIERAICGEDDFVWHALDLFLDIINIFVRMLTVLGLGNDD
ncbi:hypothetical protein SPRG_19842 [Saprolegnia parasitica CBS 223.65]|uniref:Bax inhibitor 1 n=1 Tax=Saprolegnia parasitica (strain CBS 223.65) TaxID=695850 RepID=A0A067CM55_SAPPC|nr:hypothetical protein SPRG_19842 [Saprolegnia parasitica CBS 223.65]KDO30300.1 hypothetical protein SPRG_19842 [Saprolegnia parasitica CBS 223.65]|eukprot:XP_012199088.1 hypothetical protein SPRG_19842 [Saprolegnia parasitica CBS 223.65]